MTPSKDDLDFGTSTEASNDVAALKLTWLATGLYIPSGNQTQLEIQIVPWNDTLLVRFSYARLGVASRVLYATWAPKYDSVWGQKGT